MPYCIYLRKSRADAEAEARGEGETLSRHQTALLDLARRRGLPVTKIYREIVSGETISARPQVQHLLADVGDHRWEGVLVMEVERLARGDTIDQGIIAQTFQYGGAKIITPFKDYDPNDPFDEEYFEFGLFMARREYKAINRRLQQGRLASVKEGKYVGSRPPYGYRRVRLAHQKGFTLEPVPEQADVVKMIFEWYTVGVSNADGSRTRLGTGRIANKLNAMGIPALSADHWEPGSIRDILKSPVYAGKLYWNRRPNTKEIRDGAVHIARPVAKDYLVADGLHPPIIFQETWEKARFFMSQNPPKPVSGGKTLQNPLAGLVVCACCGHKMVRRPNRRCGDYLLCASSLCQNISAPLDLVEARVLESLSQWLISYRLSLEDTPVQTDVFPALQTAVNKAEAETTLLRKQQDHLYDLLEQGIYDTATFSHRSHQLEARLEKAAAAKAEALHELDLEKARRADHSRGLPEIEHFLAVYEALPTAKAKNDLLSQVIDHIVYQKTQKGSRSVTPDSFSLTLFPRIPSD